VLLQAYQEWGPACVDRLNGMFAFAIWDADCRRLFLARDRYGIKPLYYWFRNGTLVFGSEIKSLLQHPDVSVQVDVPALNEYFSFQNIFTDRTLFSGIRLLPPAHTLTVSAGQPDSLTTAAYWDFDFTEAEDGRDDREYQEELARLFEQAVNRQLVCDVEVGSYLSGGMDSAAIAALAQELLEQEATGDKARVEKWFSKYGSIRSELAAALARNRQVRQSYPDGIVWISCGQKLNDDDLLKRQRDLARQPPPVAVPLPDHVRRRDIPVSPARLEAYDQLMEKPDEQS